RCVVACPCLAALVPVTVAGYAARDSGRRRTASPKGFSCRGRQQMRWRRNWSDYERPRRPKVRRLDDAEKEKLLAALIREIGRWRVVGALGVEVQALRGRFYVERPTPEGTEPWGRITPVEDDLLLEVEHRSWKEVARGSPQKLIKAIASDTRGTFHGLGSL